MDDILDQMTKMNQNMGELWRNMMSGSRWTTDYTNAAQSWNPMLEAMKSSYQVSLTSWTNMMEQSLDNLFKTYSGSQIYRQVIEKQIRDAWEIADKVGSNQERNVREFLSAMTRHCESNMKKCDPGHTGGTPDL
jgi:hypothetical protein